MLGLEVVRKLAEGSAVEAFLAKSTTGQVLVQVSRPEISSDPEIYGEFLDWTRTASQLKHPALLTVEHTHCGSDGRFVVMTGPLSGRTAEQYLAERGPVSSPEALRWAKRLCEGIGYLHAHQLVHGFLSPANVFLDGDAEHPSVRLLDTGFLLFRASRSLSTRQVIVPAEYLSPERSLGQRASNADDVYGFGVLFYELLTGAPPFRGTSAEETRNAHTYARLPELPEALGAWRVVLEGCLAKFPEDRFPSMGAVRAALEAMSTAPGSTPLIDHAEIVIDDEPEVVLGTIEGLPQGTLLGPYEILGVLGEGGMGRVYRAQHRTLGRQVAIKVLRDELSAGTAMNRRFVQEAQAVNRVRHPNIVEVFDLVQETPEEGGRTWFVMELLEGQSLKSLGRETPVVLPRTLRYLRQAAEALTAAHAVGVIHRDLKPDNLFVAQDTLKVLDFGVAQVRDLNRGIPRTTQAGQVVGTPLWMAPEQILGKEVDARADVYGLATVLYVMITRRFPFDGVAMADVVMQRLQKDARPVGKFTFLGEEIPSELSRLLTECLSRDVAGRPMMAQVAARLGAIERGLEASTQGGSERGLTAGSTRWVTWLLGGLLALSAGALAWLQSHH